MAAARSLSRLPRQATAFRLNLDSKAHSLTTLTLRFASIPTLSSRSPRSSLTESRFARTQIRYASSVSHNQLANLEKSANGNPGNTSAQNAFYGALLRANMPQILVERYETGRYATNAACDAMYYRALERLGQNAVATGAAPAPAGTGSRGYSQEQLGAIGRAVAASLRGGSSASVRTRPGQVETGDKSAPLHVVIDEARGSMVWKIIRFLLIFGFTFYAVVMAFQFAIDLTGSFRRVGGANNFEVKPEHQKARFSDVQGCDEAKEELQEIVDFLKSPEKYNQLGGKLPKGVLMVGPPGTGKTLLARAVAGEAGVPFFYMAGSEFDEVYVGVGAKRVRELFQSAKSKAPAIVFIDEIDAVGGKRNERDAAYHMQTLNQMLTELDGFDQSSGVVFIAATNFPQMLDKALTRPGRFDRQVVVPLPDVRGRVNLLKHYMKNMQIATDVDAAVIARGTPGFSGADLENLINQAAVHASKSNVKKIRMFDLDWAKDRILMGAEKKSTVIQQKDKVMTAYHEAGHALVSMFTAGCDPLYKCTIIPRGQALGVTLSMAEMDKVSMSKREVLARLDMAMGGKAAEELIYGEDMVTTGCSSDLSNATDLAYNLVTQWGMSPKLGSVAFDGKMYQTLSATTKKTIEDEVRQFLDDAQDRARKLLVERRVELERLTQGLLKYETLNREEMEKVVRGEELVGKEAGDASVPIKVPMTPEHAPTPGKTDVPGASPFPSPVGSS